jgi:hypothetical protein
MSVLCNILAISKYFLRLKIITILFIRNLEKLMNDLIKNLIFLVLYKIKINQQYFSIFNNYSFYTHCILIIRCVTLRYLKVYNIL